MLVQKVVCTSFRSEDGLYRLKYPYSPGRNAQSSLFMEYPEEFYSFIKKKVLCGSGCNPKNLVPMSNWLGGK